MQQKKMFAFLLAMCFFITRNAAQSGLGINEDGSLPNPNALLDVKSTTKGVLIPRMSTGNRLAIPHTQGLLVYDTTVQQYYYSTGTAWKSLSASATTGNAWLLSGNSNTTDADYLGTADARPLRFRVMANPAGIVDATKKNTALGYNTNPFNQPDSGIHNTSIGSYSMFANTTGSYNTATGASALMSNTKGIFNTANGAYALGLNKTGQYNTAIGARALEINSSGVNNTALGGYALNRNSTGSYNTATGSNSMERNLTGYNNTASGGFSLFANTTGHDNVAIGQHALGGNTQGEFNTAVGARSLLYNTKGVNNSALGYFALSSNETGNYNTAVGDAALMNNKTSFNTAVGSGSLTRTTNGQFNTALGVNTLSNNTIGGFNTVIGHDAVKFSWENSFITALGANTYQSNGGDLNTVIGAYSDVKGGQTVSNSTAIGYNAVVHTPNSVRLGNSYVTTVEGPVSYSTPSDGRYKYSVQEDVKGLDFIMQLRPVTYNFDVKKFDDESRAGRIIHETDATKAFIQRSYAAAAGIRRSGFIAQEVERAAATTGYDFSGVKKPASSEDHYSLSYESFVVPLVKAVQEQQREIQELKARIAQLEKK